MSGYFFIIIVMFIEISQLNANSEDSDQTPHSDLGLRCLPMSFLWDDRLIWVKPFLKRFNSEKTKAFLLDYNLFFRRKTKSSLAELFPLKVYECPLTDIIRKTLTIIPSIREFCIQIV